MYLMKIYYGLIDFTQKMVNFKTAIHYYSQSTL